MSSPDRGPLTSHTWHFEGTWCDHCGLHHKKIEWEKKLKTFDAKMNSGFILELCVVVKCVTEWDQRVLWWQHRTGADTLRLPRLQLILLSQRTGHRSNWQLKSTQVSQNEKAKKLLQVPNNQSVEISILLVVTTLCQWHKDLTIGTEQETSSEAFSKCPPLHMTPHAHIWNTALTFCFSLSSSPSHAATQTAIRVR